MSKELEFPYEQIRDKDGDYFPTYQSIKEKGYPDDQIWSVYEYEDEMNSKIIHFIYGKPCRYNWELGYFATKEKRVSDEEEYHETIEMESGCLDNSVEGQYLKYQEQIYEHYNGISEAYSIKDDLDYY